MALIPGTRLGAYQILSPLGAGGMGEVYRARDTHLGRDVAIKILGSNAAGSPDRVAQLDREARTIAGFNHPNLVTVFSVEDVDGFHFLAMELVEGETLARSIVPGGLPLARILEIAIATADALVAVHEKGVVHRDLKPGNIMLTREGRVKVLDFGLARVEPGTASGLDETVVATRSDTEIAGTAPYMAPEQLRGEPVDARTDLFALGVILYELASGRRPFTGTTYADVASSILRDEPTDIAHFRSDLPADLVAIVERCLEKQPDRRFQGALEVMNELRRMKSLLEHGVRLAPVPTPDEVASIAVLPFANRSPDKEDAYFSDGLADELLNTLVKIQGLRVAARTSSFQFRDTREDVTAIGRKLRVAALLEGSVRKAGNRVRISVQLVKTTDGFHLWSGTYDRTLEDIFAVQDEIAHSVAHELRSALLQGSPQSTPTGLHAEVARAARGRATSVEVHRLYLQARHLIARASREDVSHAVELLEKAVDMEPDFARGWVELSTAHGIAAAMGWVPVAAGYGRAREAVEQALQLEPDLAEGHARLARIQMSYDRDWRGAEASFALALKLAPTSAPVLVGAAVLLQTLGRFEEAIAFARQGLDQDPVSSGAYTVLGLTLDAADRLDEAESAYRDALDIAPQRANIRAYLALAVLDQGRVPEALSIAEQEPDEGYRFWALAIIHRIAGDGDGSDTALRSLTEKYAGDAAFQIAEVHAMRGETDLAFDWLDRAYEQRDGGLTELKIRRSLRSLHGDPRWPAHLARMGFRTS